MLSELSSKVAVRTIEADFDAISKVCLSLVDIFGSTLIPVFFFDKPFFLYPFFVCSVSL